jgi:RND superfamily putative drug exporter
VPVQPFREFAFIMAVGVLIDAFLVRSILLPSLLVLAGPRAFWPHRNAHPSSQRPSVRVGGEPRPA